MLFVYLLKSLKDESLYIGLTNDLERRLVEHNNSGLPGYTNKHKPFKLVYYESYLNETDAKEREFQLKRFSNAYIQLKARIKRCLGDKPVLSR